MGEIHFADTERFLSEQHILENKQLIVEGIITSEFIRGNEPLDKLHRQTFLIEWKGSRVSRDELILYLEEVTDSKSLNVCYVPEPNTALVELTEPWGKLPF